jgi:hypothetical protein
MMFIGSETLEATVSWTSSWARRNKEYVQSFDGETSWQTTSCTTNNEEGG